MGLFRCHVPAFLWSCLCLCVDCVPYVCMHVCVRVGRCIQSMSVYMAGIVRQSFDFMLSTFQKSLQRNKGTEKGNRKREQKKGTEKGNRKREQKKGTEKGNRKGGRKGGAVIGVEWEAHNCHHQAIRSGPERFNSRGKSISNLSTYHNAKREERVHTTNTHTHTHTTHNTHNTITIQQRAHPCTHTRLLINPTLQSQTNRKTRGRRERRTAT